LRLTRFCGSIRSQICAQHGTAQHSTAQHSTTTAQQAWLF
jgi:hypothetical protein